LKVASIKENPKTTSILATPEYVNMVPAEKRSHAANVRQAREAKRRRKNNKRLRARKPRLRVALT